MLETQAHRVWIGVGTNVGDRQANLETAYSLIKEIPTTAIKKKSEPIETEAQETPTPQPPYLNAVLILETELQPLELLEKLQIIERKMGRATKADNAARPMDLDILGYDQVVFQGKTLTLPHPRMHERLFVLKPLCQIDAEWVHPKLKQTAQALLAEIEHAVCHSNPSA